MIFLLLASRTANQLLQTRLQVLQGTWQEHRDILLVPKSHESHLRLVPIPHNKTSITCHQCTHQIIFHHLLIFQLCSHHHLLHRLMCLMYIQPLVSYISAALTLMTNAVTQGNSNTTAITNALERTVTQFADALQQTIQMGVNAQAQENKNARMDKQFEKVKVFDGSKPSECHPWLEEVHALCIQTGRPFREMLLLCVGQAVRDFITDMSPEATDDQIKNDLITGYSDLQGLGCKQSAYDSIMQ